MPVAASASATCRNAWLLCTRIRSASNTAMTGRVPGLPPSRSPTVSAHRDEPVMIRTLIVEDEPHARNKLRELLQGEPDLKLVGECGDGLQALRMIRSLRPDLVFLDIQ